jgi:hypothetical protein
VLYKIKLKNAEETVVVDDFVYEFLTNDPYLAKIGFVDQLRKHSSGCAFFQKAWTQKDKSYKTETIYLHKLIAERWLTEQKTAEKRLVGAINGDKLDCRVENLIYRSRSVASRQRKTTSTTGYTGVYKENSRYRAVISHKGKTLHLGMYDTPEEAARAYNKRSVELFGEDGKVNKVP